MLIKPYKIRHFKAIWEEKKQWLEYFSYATAICAEISKIPCNIKVFPAWLWTYLADLNEQAQERLSLILEQMKASEGVTEELKAGDQMAWVRAMNSIHNRAEEIVLEEIVYR